MSHSIASPAPGNHSDPLRDIPKYIRITSAPDAAFVSFDFAIGDPNLFVELVMPPRVFEYFCQKNGVLTMTPEQSAEVDAQIAKWRYGEETLMANNQKQHTTTEIQL